MKGKLADVIEKYRRSPEFLFVQIGDVNQPGMTGDTLLHAAVVRGQMEDLIVLIDGGANVNVRGDLGSTPLHYAASRGLDEIAKALLRYGASADIKNQFGETPLDLAKLMDKPEIVRLLQDHIR